MPSRDTGTEMALRRELHSRGLRYQTHLKTLPGKPDIAFTRASIAVFVDGCFWHGCPEHGTLPKTNSDYWVPKLERNVERDRETDGLLRTAGWVSIRVWEHEDPQVASRRIVRTVRSRRASRAT